jgi:DNA polymerase III epsilon subunit-like protein
MLAVDTETSGLDIHHEARPFFVTTFSPEDGLVNYEWAVDPLTRKVKVNRKDADQIQSRILAADSLVLQNAKFDVHALASVGILRDSWPWGKTHDTLMAGHLIHSGERHNLTDMARRYCRFDIEPLEDALEDACKKARNWARVHRKGWKIARDDDPGLPSMGGTSRRDRGAEENKGWKADSWLPKRLAREQKLDPDHPWWTVLEEYASADSQATWMLFQAQERILKGRGQWEMYLDRMNLPPIAYGMERRGITLKRSAWESSVKEFTEASRKEKAVCEGIAAKYDYDLKVPKGGTSNHSLAHFCFGRPVYSTKTLLVGKKQKPKEVRDEQVGTEQFLNLPVVELTGKGAPSLRASAIDTYRATLDSDSDQYRFVSALGAKRKRDTALSYLKGYARFWLPWKQPAGTDGGRGNGSASGTGWFVLHSSMNPTGTATLRWSSNNPNCVGDGVSHDGRMGPRGLPHRFARSGPVLEGHRGDRFRAAEIDPAAFPGCDAQDHDRPEHRPAGDPGP